VEIEFSGLDVAQVATIVRSELGGVIEISSPYEQVIRGDDAGPWKVELDYRYLKELGRRHAAEDRGASAGEASAGDESASTTLLEDLTEPLVRLGAEVLVPVEVISPPLPMSRLADVQRLIDGLRRAGAKGTGASVTYAFGMQLNPELPALDARTITGYLQAFLCLYDWLLRQAAIDPTRKLTGYSAGFPTAFVRQVIGREYRPTLTQLIGDYLEANPSRNRALDLLPLFAHLAPEQVAAVNDDPRIKPRPTFHYRLPNSEIDDPQWGVHVAWNDWLEVERLAADPERLRRMCARYSEVLSRPLGSILSDWAEEATRWRSDR